MAHSKVVSVRRVGGKPDHASRAKVFGPDANSDTLICGSCGYGEQEDWTPTMKKSQCPACGNREGHKVRSNDDPATNSRFQSLVFNAGSPESKSELENLVRSGWEMVCIAPFRMVADHHGKRTTTIVNEYFIMLRRLEFAVDAEEGQKETRA